MSHTTPKQFVNSTELGSLTSHSPVSEPASNHESYLCGPNTGLGLWQIPFLEETLTFLE